ncbi:putative mitogen-activated protein kinase kinase kinase STE-STE11 family [Rosa chinensis]|uniref:mitogen-activated protein kinase kinase kinase n=1 Tax=Rosa chinensis TaxID=74649 RepID=A0A2P6S248_ROSCH|nr:mitogen-activated protein kinase kinase kinase 18 [Rosa chinensis]PRQ52749.1 putative mitogen-activated protein kinase kinase kinase STE-STE11 family [Rosa chinensis]
MDWTRGHTVGRGSSAAVSIATSSGSGSKVFAVKSAELSQSDFLQREQKILSSLSSPHVVSYLGHDITRENNKLMYNIFMEYVAGGTIIDAIRNRGGQFEESAIGFYTRQIAKGLEYLHSVGLVHCDIKGRNVLVGEEGPKIADFGCARWADPAAEAVPIGGTPMFMSPEVARGEEQGFPCDVWALGCTVIEMATGGSVPWPNAADPVTLLYRIAYSGESPEIPSFLSNQARDFLAKCFMRDPKERWTVTQLLKHPFLEEMMIINSASSTKQVQESTTSSFSPTSILDQGIWNSLQESETLGNLVDHPSVENSYPDDRIRLLSLFSGMLRWSSDEDYWITVRGNDCGESNPIVNDGEAQVDVIDSKISCRDINLNNIGACKSRKISSSINSNSSSTSSVVALSNLILERHKGNLLFPSIPIIY